MSVRSKTWKPIVLLEVLVVSAAYLGIIGALLYPVGRAAGFPL